MTKFRPCIDLHDGRVKQIVGGTLTDGGDRPVENHVADQPAEWFAAKYAADGLAGGHIIKLGPGNDAAALAALAAYPCTSKSTGMQIGGGITVDNANEWIEAGASHVIVTSTLFDDVGTFLPARLDALVDAVGRQRIVLDLSCRRIPGDDNGPAWAVAMNRWQTLTELRINAATLDRLSESCDEFLIHAADVEGLCRGIDADLVHLLGQWAQKRSPPIAMTYAGGVASMGDLEMIAVQSGGKMDVTVGSALDLFGGTKIRYADLLQKY